MPSNKELAENIAAEAELKGAEMPDIDGQNNMQLLDTLKELKAFEKPDEDVDDQDEPEKKPEYYIADGKALTSKKGMLLEGDEIKAEYLPGGLTRIKELIKAGVVAKG